jgi:hypothetical protein
MFEQLGSQVAHGCSRVPSPNGGARYVSAAMRSPNAFGHDERVSIGEIIGPTFDSPPRVILNTIGLGILLGAVMTVLVGLITRTRKLQWHDLLIGGNLLIAGVFVPLFPLVWIVGEAAARPRIKSDAAP